MKPDRIARAFKAAEECFQKQGALPAMVLGFRADGALIVSPSPPFPVGEELNFLRAVVERLERQNARSN